MRPTRVKTRTQTGPNDWRRRLRRLPSLLLALILSVLVFSCATAPETGRQQLLLVSPSEEARLGAQTFEQLKQRQPVVTRGEEVAMLQRVGERISRVASLPHARWEFVLFEDETPNAFALPGGKVGVNTGILPITQDEAGLATVIAHEIAHVVARHGAERMSQQMLVELGGAGISAALGTEAEANRELIMQAYGVGAQLGVLLPYSRTQELEADRLGLLFMARAGYDPRAAAAFWRRFAAYNARRGGPMLEFLSTHPLDHRRIAELERSMPRAVAEHERARAR
ncbi:MAG: M48 family metallopeptidase [Halochromatium sp.]|uniref:M48 family metallopeptidase n=1 Tax=Halochromatium sp. TaxID=2049430 RepID=UPI0039793BF0